MYARPVEDVIADLQKEFVRMLPGGRGTSAAWAAFCAAWQGYEFAKSVVEEYPGEPTPRTWIYCGEISAHMSVIYRIADAMKVKTVVDTEPDVG